MEYLDGLLASVRNPDGIWVNTQLFKEAGNHWMKYGYYTDAPWESHAWYEYWGEQRRRCIKGYTVGGVKIPGDYYFYLNFCPILKVPTGSQKIAKKVSGFPDFWDGDYNYYWVREIARTGVLESAGTEAQKETIIELDSMAQAIELKKLYERLQLIVKIQVDYLRGGYNLIVGKSRRKGYSYKNASIAACNFFMRPYSYTMLGAYEAKYLYPKGISGMAFNYINFNNKHCGWVMASEFVHRPAQGHIRASNEETNELGAKIEVGFMSEIQSFTFKDNADAGRGKDAYDLIIEEAGAFGTPGLLKDTYAALEDCVKAGDIKTGLITIFGTSGDMEGGTADYAEMFDNPLAYDMLPFQNIWDENYQDSKCGFFHPTNWNMEGHCDIQGNSDFEGARQVELIAREELKKNGASSKKIQKRMQERPLGPGEAFGMVSFNCFPVPELKQRLEYVKAKKLQESVGMVVELVRDGKDVRIKQDLKGKLTPITSFLTLPEDTQGAVVMYEAPISSNPPRNLYKIGYDPVRQDKGTSLAAIVVLKGTHEEAYISENLVAEYIGRKDDTDSIDEVAEKLAILYNCEIMHENEVAGVKTYFRNIKRLDLLAAQPEGVIKNAIKESKVARIYGCHMNEKLKDSAERYTKQWLLKIHTYDEHGNPIRGLDTICSKRLLEELIAYDRKKNLDAVSALFMAMFQMQEDELQSKNRKSKEEATSLSNKLAQIAKKMYRNN